MTSGKCGGLRKALLAVYVFAAVCLPLGHHDVICHLKSPTHCTTCAVASSGETPADTRPLDNFSLPDAGQATLASAERRHAEPLRASSGRSPPSLG
jgi:hypothetical protein